MESLYAEQVLNEGIDQSGEGLVAMNGIDVLVNGEFRREGGITRRKGFETPAAPVVNATNSVSRAGHTLVANDGALAVVRKFDAANVDAAVHDGINDAAGFPRSFALPGTVVTAAQLRDSAGFGNANVAVARANVGSAHAPDGVLLACVVGQLAGADSASSKWKAVIVEVESGMLLQQTLLTGQRPVPIATVSAGVVRFNIVDRLNGASDIRVIAWDSGTNAWTAFTSLLDSDTASSETYPAVCPDPANAARFYVAFADASEADIQVRRVNFNHSLSLSYDFPVNEVQLVAVCPSLAYPTSEHLHFAYAMVGGASVRLIGNAFGGSLVTAEEVVLTRTGGSYSWRHLSVCDTGETSAGVYAVHVAGCETTGTFTFGDTHRCRALYSLAGSPLLPSYTVGTEETDDNLYLLAEHAVLFPDDLAEPALNVSASHGVFQSRVTDVPGTPSRLTTTHSFLRLVASGAYYDTAALGVGARLGATMLPGSAYNGAADDTNATYERHRLSRVVYDATSRTYFVAALDLEQAPAAGTLLYGIRVLRYNFSSYRAGCEPLPRAQLGNLQYIGGNLLRCYDGQRVTEAGPFHPPAAPTLAAAASGSLTLLGTYIVQAVLLFEDAKGLVHRSAPSPAQSLTLTGANGTIEATFNLDVFPHTRSAAESVRLEVYRSEADGTVLYYDQSVDLLESAGPLVVTIDQADAAVTSNKNVYVAGDVLPAEPPPPASALVAVGNRLFGISSVDPRTVFFSKELEEGYAAEFNAVLQVRLESSSSAPVALGVLNDLLVVFTREEAWAISTHGGPDATGAGAFGLFERLASDCGASSPEAAVSTPFGILVHGPSGFRLLTQANAVDVPAVVDIAGPGTEVLRSMHVPERTEAWFIVRDDSTANRIVVFSYARGKVRWSTYEVADTEELVMRDMVNLRGVPWLLVEYGAASDNTYELRRLSASLYVDGDDVRPSFRARTRWFKPEGHMGDSRFWKLHVFGTYGSRDKLQADVYVMDVSGLPADDKDGTDFLEGSYEWTEDQLAEDDRVLHVRQRLKRQRGAAARVELRLVDGVGDSAPSDRGPILHAVGWDYGVRGGSAGRGATMGSEEA